MEQINAFLADLGAEIKAVFNDKVVVWSSTNSIPKAVDTGAPVRDDDGVYFSEFERLSSLFELSFSIEEDFIPNDLLDFEKTNDGDAEPIYSKNQNKRAAQQSFFVENRRQTSTLFQNKEKKQHLSEETESPDFGASPHNYEKNKNSLKPFERTEDEFETKPKTQGVKPDDILRGGIFSVFEAKQTDNDDKHPNVGEAQILAGVKNHQNNAIWENSLGNLSAFAALSNSLTPSSTPIETNYQTDFDKPPMEENTTKTNVKAEKNSQYNQNSSKQKQRTIENEALKSSFEFDFDNTVYAENKANYDENEVKNDIENDVFLPIDKETVSRDFDAITDDLLDALTDRIRRDFNRFY